MLFMSFIPSISADNSFNESGPELETYILSGFSLIFTKIHVENIGDETAHNVRISDVIIGVRSYQELQMAVDLLSFQ